MRKLAFAVLVALGSVATPATAAAASQGKSCLDIVRRLGPIEGYYTIEPKVGQAFTVYCRGEADYLPLCKTSGDHNFSEYAAGGAVYGTTVRTQFAMVRIDPVSLMVDIADLTFATSTGSLSGASAPTDMAFGAAAGCENSYTQTGRANIDLTGTPFSVSGTVFFATGYQYGGSVRANGGAAQDLTSGAMVTVSGKTVNVNGGGYCGGAGPYGLNSHGEGWVDPIYRGVIQPAVKLAYTGAQTCVP